MSAAPHVHFLSYLEGLRGLAALYVVLFHADMELTRDRPASIAHIPFHGALLHYGHFAVALFIVISGYVLSLPVAHGGALPGGVGAFLKRRARRLLPGYYVALGLAIPLALVTDLIGGTALKTWTAAATWTFVAQVATHVLLVHNLTDDSSVMFGLNGSLWTVALELQIYLVFAFVLVPLRSRYGVVAMVAFAVIAGLLPMLAGFATGHPATYPLHLTCLWFLGLFGLGSAAAFAARGDARVARLPWNAIAAVLGVGAVGAIIVFRSASLDNDLIAALLDLLLGVAAATLFVFIAQSADRGRQPRIARLLAWRPFVALGAFSYSLYLIHQPLLGLASVALARTTLSDAGVTALVYAVVVPAIVATAYAFSLAFERPFISRYRRDADDRLLRHDSREPRAASDEPNPG